MYKRVCRLIEKKTIVLVMTTDLGIRLVDRNAFGLFNVGFYYIRFISICLVDKLLGFGYLYVAL